MGHSDERHRVPARWGDPARGIPTPKHQARKRTKPKLLSPDIFWWGGGLPREGVGAKKFGMSLENPGNQTFLAGIRDFAGISQKRPKSLRKKCLGSILVP